MRPPSLGRDDLASYGGCVSGKDGKDRGVVQNAAASFSNPRKFTAASTARGITAPLGTELKRNLKDYWWKCMTQLRDDVVGYDGSILMNAAVWKASGHVDTFSDPMVECLLTRKRYRADQIEPQSGTAYYYKGITTASGAIALAVRRTCAQGQA